MPRIGILFPLLIAGAAWAGQVFAACSAPTGESKAYLRATNAVRRLPEFRSWTASHAFPVAFGAPTDVQAAIREKCYWSVTVYADRPERWEYWHSFFVSRETDQVAYVEDAEGGPPMPLTAWRKKQADTRKIDHQH